MDAAPLVSVHFVISGRDFDPAACTEALGLSPTNIWRQQRQYLKDRPDLPNVEWLLGFEKKPFYSIDDAATEVIALIWPMRERIRKFLSESGLEAALSCRVRIHKDRPEYCLSSDVMGKLGWLGCEFCLDIYDYSESSDKE